MRWPLRNQILWPLLAVAVASLAAVGAGNGWIAARQTRQQVDQQLRSVVGVLTSTNFPLTDAVLRHMHDLCGAEFVLADEAGRPRASSGIDLRALPASPAAASNVAEVALGEPLMVNGHSYFHSALRMRARLGKADAAVLHILFPRDAYLIAWKQAFVPPLLAIVAAAAAAATVAHVVAGRISRAAVHLGGEVERLAQGDYAEIGLPRRDDEIRDLAASVNRAAAKLADYEVQVRRGERTRTVAMLGAGLAHELRNSATGCLLALDLHAERCHQKGDAESLEVAKRQLRLMENLLQRFLHVGRTGDKSRPQEVDFGALVDDLLPLVEPTAKHARVSLRWPSPEIPILVRAVPQELGHAVLNLLLNGIEAAQRADSPKSHEACISNCREVHVDLAAEDDRCGLLTVSDTGPGPADGVVDSLFEPFVTAKPEGIGLGLALVKQSIESQGGAVDWDRVDRWTRFHIRLPLARPVSPKGIVHAAYSGH